MGTTTLRRLHIQHLGPHGDLLLHFRKRKLEIHKLTGPTVLLRRALNASETNVSGLKNLSAAPVPLDSCLPGCTAQSACSVSLQRYGGFFGPYFPPVSLP